MTKAKIEDIGVNAGLPRERVEQEFLNLAGIVWAGYVYPDDAPPSSIWVGLPRKKPLPPWFTVSFPREWFQAQGIVPRAPIID
jgi:hypothetical protein